MEFGKLLKLVEVAEILRVSRQTALRLIKTGQLKAIKVGRQWRVSEEELRRFIEGGAEKGTEEKKGKNG